MANTHPIPELLAPAGSLEKLKIALSYGADAVYLGGQKYGLRAAADNFTYDELKEGVEFAHKRSKQVYVVLNSFFFDSDFLELLEFVSFLESIKVDALIVSDLGVVDVIASNSHIPIHLSTQASCLNSQSGKFWKDYGIKRLILGREVSIHEAAQIKKATGLEVELFIHGSMCMSYSGNCTISNFTQGRDSNRGGCSHSCRFDYDLIDDQNKKSSFFMSSKDLNGLSLLDDFVKAGIDSIKVEGRMKGPLYAASISKTYKEALNYYSREQRIDAQKLSYFEQELNKFTHRSYFPGSLDTPAGLDSVFDERDHSKNQTRVFGTIIDVVEDKFFVIDSLTKILPKSSIEILKFDEGIIKYTIETLRDLNDQELESTRPNQLIKVPYIPGVAKNNIVRVLS